MGFAKLAVAATILGAASVSAQSIAFTSRPVIKVGSGQMKVKAVMAYDFATHSGFCPGGEAPAIRTRFRSAADSAAAGILNSYPLATARSRGDAKQAITVSSYVSGQNDLQIEAWGPCPEGSLENVQVTLADFTYASLSIVSAAEIRGPIDGVYTSTVRFDYDVGSLAGNFQAKASLKSDSADGAGPSSATSLDASSGTASITVDVTEQFSTANADAPFTLLLFISPDSDFADFSNRVISTTQTDFTYVEDFGPNGRQGFDNVYTGEMGGKGMGEMGEGGGKGMGEMGEGGGKGMGSGKGEGGSKGMGKMGEGGSKGVGSGKGMGEMGGKGMGAMSQLNFAPTAAKSGVGIAAIALLVGGTALVAVRRHRSRPVSESEELLPTVTAHATPEM
jgi:hypothetical protein